MAVNVQASKCPAHPANWSESELIERLLARVDAAWAELVRRYRALIYRCISRVTSRHAPHLSTADLDEIYADVMVGLLRDDLRKLRLYDPARGTRLSSWIGMLAINAAYDHLRSAGRRPLLDGGLHPEGTEHDERTPLAELVEKERWDHLNDMLACFSDRDRTFLKLYYGQGLDAERVAERMHISLKTVYSKKHKIREHLRRRVRDAGEGCPIGDLAA